MAQEPVLKEPIIEATGSLIGEPGRPTFLQADAEMIQRLDLNYTYANPVLIAGPLSFNGGGPTTLRVRNVTSSSFEIQIDECSYLDGFHTMETVSHMDRSIAEVWAMPAADCSRI